MKYLFLDTNIFLHYKHFEEIDWKGMIGGEAFCIVVPPIVIKEIDKLKDSGKIKVQKRAKLISTLFGCIFLENKQLIFNVLLGNDAPENKFDGIIFSKEISDDRFILSALCHEACLEDKVVIAADNIVLIKAKNNGLQYIKLPEEYKLKNELTDEENEILKIKKELDEYKKRQSKPGISFSNGKSTLSLKRPIISNLEEEVNALLETEKKQNPYKEFVEKNVTSVDVFTNYHNILSPPPSRLDIEKYNKELDEYFLEFKKYIHTIKMCEISNSYMIKFDFLLFNEGTAQTGDLDIFVYFPEHIKLYNKESKKEIVVENPPLKPIIGNSIMSRDILKLINTMGNGHAKFGYQPDYISYWDISRTIDNSFKFTEKKLNHSLQKPLKTISVSFNASECNSFNISWTIIDSSLTKPVNGVLHVILE